MNWKAAALGVTAVGALVLGLAVSGVFENSVVSGATREALSPAQMTALVADGERVAIAGNCAGCHTQAPGPVNAGGRPFSFAIGTVYSTNITPDKAHGIGGWTRHDFHRAMRDGHAPRGRLYPAMPYDSYRDMTERDVDALFAYLMSRPAEPVANKPNAMTFPFNLRPLLAFWNIFNLHREPLKPDPAQTPRVQRGQYLADAVAHCRACHTPRNWMMGMDRARDLQGEILEKVWAPAITRAGLEEMGFDAASHARILKTGLSRNGSLDNQMYDVMMGSTRWMPEADLEAITAYLYTVGSPGAKAPAPAAPDGHTPGRLTYQTLCASCHGDNGEGVATLGSAMRDNADIRLDEPRNLIRTLLLGVPSRAFPEGERRFEMPSYRADLDDKAIADLASYLRQAFGGRGAVNPETVASLRKELADVASNARRP